MALLRFYVCFYLTSFGNYWVIDHWWNCCAYPSSIEEITGSLNNSFSVSVIGRGVNEFSFEQDLTYIEFSL